MLAVLMSPHELENTLWAAIVLYIVAKNNILQIYLPARVYTKYETHYIIFKHVNSVNMSTWDGQYFMGSNFIIYKL